MTGPDSRLPSGGRHAYAAGATGAAARFLTGLVRPGHANVVLCHLLVLIGPTALVALVYSVRFAEIDDAALRGHYLYLRTSIALLLIGACLGALLIVLGAALSSALILAGLVILLATMLLTLARSLRGLVRGLTARPLPDPRRYLP